MVEFLPRFRKSVRRSREKCFVFLPVPMSESLTSVMEMLADGPSLVAGMSVEGVVFNRGNKVVVCFSMSDHVKWRQTFCQ